MCLVNQNENLLLANKDGHIALYEVSSLKEIGRRQGHRGPIVGLTSGPRDKQFTSIGVDSTYKIWSVTSVAFSPMGSLLASGGYDKVVRIWDFTADPPTKPIAELPGHTHYICHTLFANEGRILFSADAAGNLFAWDVASGDLIDRFSGHDGTVDGLDLSPDGKTLVSGDSRGTIRVWDLANWKAGTSCETKTIETQSVWGLRFSDDGSRLFSIHNINELRVWETGNWTLLNSIKISDATYVISSELSPGEFVLGGTPLGTLEYVNVPAGTSVLGHRLQNGQIYELTVNADRSRLFSACSDQTVKVFSLPDNRQVLSLTRDSTATPVSIAFSDRNKLLAAGYGDGQVSIWGDLRPLLNRRSRKDFKPGSSKLTK
jgi:WD40 repeat protein